MLYLVGGASRAGKSILARKLAKKIGASYMPLDSFFISMHQAFPEAGVKGNQADDEKAKRMWKFQKSIFDYLIYCNDMDYVIEGVTMLPSQVSRFLKRNPKHAKAVFIGYADTTEIEKYNKNMNHKDNPNDWLTPLNKNYQYRHYSKNIERSKRLEKECARVGIPFFDTSKDFEKAHKQAMTYLMKDNVHA